MMNLDTDKITELLKTENFARKVVYVTQTDSTNNLAKQDKTKPHGTLFIADVQTVGRGRNGKIWLSADCGGLWMSILLKPENPMGEMASFTLAVGLAVVKALRENFNINAFIKWPNDIVLEGKKLCGILCEMSAECIVAGIGINLNTVEFEEEISQIACSVKSITGQQISREEMCAKILNSLEPIYCEYQKNGMKKLISEYKKYCITVGKEVTVIKNGQSIDAEAVDITVNGELLIRGRNGYEVVSSGEVSVRGLFGYS